MKKVVLGLVVLASIVYAGRLGSGGVREVRQADYESGVQFYRLTCNNGSSTIVGQRNGYWVDNGFSSFGDRFRNMSINEFAQSACE